MTAREHDNGPRWLDDGQQHSWRALILGTTLLFDRLDQDLRPHGLSHTEYGILVRLDGAGGQMRMAAIADAFAHSRSRVTHTVKRMERAGLVERVDSTDDGRGVYARLTAEGRQLLVDVAPVHVRGVRDYLVDLVDPEDLATFGRVMDAVCDRLVEDHPDAEMRTEGRD